MIFEHGPRFLSNKQWNMWVKTVNKEEGGHLGSHNERRERYWMAKK